MNAIEAHLALFALIILYGILAAKHLLPSISSLQGFADLLNSKGGNILVLLILSLLFFETGVRMIYWCLERAIEGKLNADNAVMMMGVTFITGSCFGGSFSSMLKVMSGETPTIANSTTTTTTSSATNKTEGPK
jgi:hypothetical protein